MILHDYPIGFPTICPGFERRALREAEKLFGLETLIHLVTCIGFYTMHSCTANAFDIVPPGDMPIPLKK